jgi:hypothetical protein
MNSQLCSVGETVIPSVVGTGEIGQQLTDLPQNVPGERSGDLLPLHPSTDRTPHETSSGIGTLEASRIARTRLGARNEDALTVSSHHFVETLLPTLDLSPGPLSETERTSSSPLTESGRSEAAGSVFRPQGHRKSPLSWVPSIWLQILQRFAWRQHSSTAPFRLPATGQRERPPGAGRIALDHSWVHLAIITAEDTILCHSLDASSGAWHCVVTLRARTARSLSCLEFRPWSRPSWMLAAGAERGIALWSADSSPVSRYGQMRPSRETSSAQNMPPNTVRFRLFEAAGHRQVQSLAWSADGRLLASGARTDTAVLVWDVAAQAAQVLYRVAVGADLVMWSPWIGDAAVLLAVARHGTMFRLWSADSSGNWASKEWHRPRMNPQTVSWCHRSVAGKSERHWLLGAHCNQPELWCWVLDPITRLALRPVTTVRLPARPLRLAWDSSGQRLAVIFAKRVSLANSSMENEPLATGVQVALYVTELEPTVLFTPLGFLQAPAPDAEPLHMQWHPGFPYRSGALLAISWSTHQVTFHPCIF